jgi:hypothetical protein
MIPKQLFLYDVPIQNRPTSTIALPPSENPPSPTRPHTTKTPLREDEKKTIILAAYATAKKNVTEFLSTLPDGAGSMRHSVSVDSYAPSSCRPSTAQPSPWLRPRSRFRANNIVASPGRSSDAGAAAMADAVALPDLRAGPPDAASRSASRSPAALPPPASRAAPSAPPPPPPPPKYLGDAGPAGCARQGGPARADAPARPAGERQGGVGARTRARTHTHTQVRGKRCM